MQITIREVARRLNLSITTVSRALDGYADVADKTRQRVIKTAQEMGYVPNRAARELRRQRTDAIGYIIPASNGGFADPFFSEFIAGLGDEASAHKYDLLVTTASPSSPEEKGLYQRWIQGRKVDGMVLNRIRLKDWRLNYLEEQKIPHVSLERSPFQTDFVGVEADSYHGVMDLIDFLIKQGHSRIAYIGGNHDLKIERDRYSGYLKGLKSGGITTDPNIVIRSDLTREGGYLAAGNLLKNENRPTAIVCINDMTAIGAMGAVHEHGLRVGRDIAIAGFDGISDSAYTQPTLTTIDQPVYNIARQLVSMLLALINNEPLIKRRVKMQPELLIRESTDGWDSYYSS